ncbi:MAG TPA: nitronate monooxygenase [Devosia sp.]|nr:nitronate monooxygenase [Devosia sp.]
MLKTDLSQALGLDTPILNAGMAFVAGPALAAAVSNAGGLGVLGTGMAPPDGLRDMIRATRALTARPFGVDLLAPFVEDGHIEALVQERVPVAVFFWGQLPGDSVARLRRSGVRYWAQVGTMAEAAAAVAEGAETLIVQGSEAGGHNRSEAPLVQLLPRMRRAFPGVPMVAAGGIFDGASMAAALCLGADAVWCGTRFLASSEANAHKRYKQAVVEAGPGATEITRVFGPEWPDQPMRALANKAVAAARGREAAALAESGGEIIGTVLLGGARQPVPRYSAILPVPEFDADLDWACLTAGVCAADIHSVEPAGEIVRAMTRDAARILARLAPEVA